MATTLQRFFSPAQPPGLRWISPHMGLDALHFPCLETLSPSTEPSLLSIPQGSPLHLPPLDLHPCSEPRCGCPLCSAPANGFRTQLFQKGKEKRRGQRKKEGVFSVSCFILRTCAKYAFIPTHFDLTRYPILTHPPQHTCWES